MRSRHRPWMLWLVALAVGVTLYAVRDQRVFSEVLPKSPEGWTAALTGALFVATWGLYRATTNIVRGADDTARRQLRAYVGVKSAGFANVPTKYPGDVPQLLFDVAIKNRGQTPATDLTVRVSKKVLPRELPSDFIFVDEHATGTQPKTVLHPRTGMVGQNDPTANPLTREQWNDFTRGRNDEGLAVSLYVYGTVRYTDAFSARHWTNFAYRYDAERARQRRPDGTAEWMVVDCPLHNDMGTYAEDE